MLERILNIIIVVFIVLYVQILFEIKLYSDSQLVKKVELIERKGI